ncbi:MAG: LysR family transcriptional regulator [Crenarchaeota archaeon]|nr:LysR family transcriptional regulator [Thermoproteota archaeon]
MDTLVDDKTGDLMGKKYRVRLDVILEVDGEKLMDSRLARILLLIEKHGSILAAARTLGIPYSRAWDYILKAERVYGDKIVEARRGGRRGGGARLTEKGKELLREYLDIYRRLTKRDLEVKEIRIIPPDIEYMGSHDPGVNRISAIMREKYGLIMDHQWVGSGLGIASIVMGEADLAGIHIYDRDTDNYNLPYIRKSIYSSHIALIRGYKRSIGFATRHRMSIDEILDGLLSGKLVLVNRQKASGTRILLDTLIMVKTGYENLDEIVSKIKGYEDEVNTHFEVAEKVASGEADVGLCIEWVAKQYGLEFIRIKWEHFDFVVGRESIHSEWFEKLVETLRSDEFRSYMSGLKGYEIPDDIGTIIYP